jgi:hypothetical protein
VVLPGFEPIGPTGGFGDLASFSSPGRVSSPEAVAMFALDMDTMFLLIVEGNALSDAQNAQSQNAQFVFQELAQATYCTHAARTTTCDHRTTQTTRTSRVQYWNVYRQDRDLRRPLPWRETSGAARSARAVPSTPRSLQNQIFESTPRVSNADTHDRPA